MIKVTKRSRIEDVANRWRRQYPELSDDKKPLFSVREGHQKQPKSALKIYRELCILDLSTATEDDVAEIIGNPSWTRLECECCESHVDSLLIIKSYNDSGVLICGDCLNLAVIAYSK